MKKVILAVLFAISAALPATARAQNYAPDYSNVEIWQPLWWRPVTVSGNYSMTPGDLVVVVNAANGAVVTLPSCVPGLVRMIVNSSPVYETNGSTPVVVSVQPAAADVFASGAPPLGGSGNFQFTILQGATKFRAIGSATSPTCAWVWD